MAALLACLSATSCKDLPHDATRGLFVTVDRSAVQDVPVDSIMVAVYTQDGRPVKERRFSGGERYSPVLYVVDGGCYTVMAVANWAEGGAPSPGMSRPALMEWLTRAGGAVAAVPLSGRTDACVADGDVTDVTVSLGRERPVMPVMRLTAVLPDPCMPPYEGATRAAAGPAARRFIVEAVVSGGGERVLRLDTVARTTAGAAVTFDIPMDEGRYDIRMWSDCADPETGLSPYYDAADLRQVAITQSPYSACTDARDAAYAVAEGVSVGADGAGVRVEMARPLARYRIVAVDADRYAVVQGAPSLADLTVRVGYEGFFPSRFNVVTGKPNDAVEGLSYECRPCPEVAADGSAVLASDWILASTDDNEVRLTVSVVGPDGRTVAVTRRVSVPYRCGRVTTIRGNFLTSGNGSGGVGLDHRWDDDTFVVEF